MKGTLSLLVVASLFLAVPALAENDDLGGLIDEDEPVVSIGVADKKLEGAKLDHTPVSGLADAVETGKVNVVNGADNIVLGTLQNGAEIVGSLAHGDLGGAATNTAETIASPVVGTVQAGIGLGTGVVQVVESIVSIPWNLVVEIKVGLEGVIRDPSVRDGTNVWRPAYTASGATTSVRFANPIRATRKPTDSASGGLKR